MRMGIERHSNKTSLPLEQKFPLKKLKTYTIPFISYHGGFKKPEKSFDNSGFFMNLIILLYIVVFI